MTGSSLAHAVSRHANRVHALLGAVAEPGAAERLAAEARRREAGVSRVVVAGDINRGKTSLINALVDRPGLLPVDVDVTTAVPVAVGFGRPGTIRVLRTDPDNGETTTEEVEPDRLAGSVTVGAAAPAVTGAEVLVDHPLLERGLVLIDTPGVGGMSRGHREITMAALGRADALVFVVSSVEPVTRSELEFLDEAGERISNVIVVASRADLVSRGTNTAILDEFRDKVATLAAARSVAGDTAAAQRLGRIAHGDPIPTSAYLATQAARRAERGRDEQAAEYRARSGIDTLISRLDATVTARDDVRLANVLQLIDTLTAPVEAMLTDRLAALDGDPQVVAELEARRHDMEVATGRQARWRSVLASGISKMQTQVGREVSRELTLVRDHYRNLLDSEGDDIDLDAVAGDLQASLQAAWVGLADHAARRFDEVVAELFDELALSGEGGVLGELVQPPALASLQTGSGFEDRFGLLDDAVPLATQAFLFGNIASVMAGVLGLATGGLGVLAYGIGASIAAPVVMLRRRQRDRRRWIGETQRALNEALFGQEGLARELTTELNLRIVDVRGELETLIDERLVARRRDLETRLRELHELARAETAERAAAREETTRRLAELRAVRAETTRLTGAVDARIEAYLSGGEPPPDPPSPTPGI